MMEGILDLKDLCAEIIRKIWIIAICAVVFAILFSGYKFYKEKSALLLLQQENSNKEDILAQINLTEEEQEEVDTYLLLLEKYNAQQDYILNSSLMQIDPYHVNTVDLQYCIQSEDEGIILNLLFAYRDYINNGGLAADICKESDLYDLNDIQELIHCETVDEKSYLYSNIVNIEIYGTSREECEKLAELVDAGMQEYYRSAENLFGSHSILLSDNIFHEIVDTDLQKSQVDMIAALQNTKKNISDMKDVFNEEQLSEVELLLATDEEENSQSEETVHIRISNIIKGGILGGFLSVIFVVVAYMVSGTLKTKRDIQLGCQINLLGELTVSEKRYFDNVAKKIFVHEKILNKETQKDMLIEALSALCKENEKTALSFIGDISGASKNDSIELVKLLQENGIKAEWIGDILCEPDAIKKLAQSNQAVIVGELRKSRYADIRHEVELCREYQIPLLGYIILS